ncbi:MAG: DUF6051 family protein [Deltaproteobacteria bacterium]|jgi:hypothetical protein|nr:DUF6051 family protein [Deltaproteobacteria bacterium]
MKLKELHAVLKRSFNLEAGTVPVPETGQRFENFTFSSEATDLLRNAGKGNPAPVLGDGAEDAEERELSDRVALAADSEIAENANFRYAVLLPAGESRPDAAIVLLHGLNERVWDKYLPWASELSAGTGKAVVLFPMAFHMNRSPPSWNDSRPMRRLSRFRLKARPETLCSSLSNAAISARLSSDPSRFFWSGLQSYRDVCGFFRLVRDGGHPLLAPGAKLDLFTYSIGSFLGEILSCADEEGLFSASRLLCLCGGPVFDRLYPTSKFILDSAAAADAYSFWAENLESREKLDPALGRALADVPGTWFKAFLNFDSAREFRESRLRALAPRISALAFSGDSVVHANEVRNTLQGARGDVPIPISLLQPSYPCRHEDPFPVGEIRQADSVDATFKYVLSGFCRFLS